MGTPLHVHYEQLRYRKAWFLLLRGDPFLCCSVSEDHGAAPLCSRSLYFWSLKNCICLSSRGFPPDIMCLFYLNRPWTLWQQFWKSFHLSKWHYAPTLTRTHKEKCCSAWSGKASPAPSGHRRMLTAVFLPPALPVCGGWAACFVMLSASVLGSCVKSYSIYPVICWRNPSEGCEKHWETSAQMQMNRCCEYSMADWKRR